MKNAKSERKRSISDSFGKENILLFVFSFLTAFFVLMVCTKSSFLYPFNDWSDANCIFTVGKAAGNGQVIYRDIADHKGPLLHFIHMLGYFISNDTFIGMFVIEVITGSLFVFFSLKTALLYINKTFALISVPIFMALAFSSIAFCQGDSAEELCLPVFAFSMYILLKAFRSGIYMSGKQLFAVGVLSACVLCIKYTMLGFFFGWIIVPVIWLIKDKKYREILSTFLWIGAGVLTVVIPVLIYFVINGALGDLWEVYFYDNIFLYSKIDNNASVFGKIISVFAAVKQNMYIFALDSKFMSLPIFAGMFGFLFIKGKKQKLALYLCFILTVFTIFGTERYFAYYGVVLSVFSVFGYIALFRFVSFVMNRFDVKSKLENKKMLVMIVPYAAFAVSVGLSVILCFKFSPNAGFMKYSREELPQYKFKEIISREQNPTLLNYGGMDAGFYTVCNIVPNCKYFCSLNLPISDISETQDKYVENGEGMFIVTINSELENVKYELVSTEDFSYEDKAKTYRLYRLKNIA